MIKIAILGDIGAGKTFVSKLFNCPVFNADTEVNEIYKKNKICYQKLKKKLPDHIKSFPIKKIELSRAILSNNHNIKKINSIVHPLVRKKMNIFLKRKAKNKLVVLKKKWVYIVFFLIFADQLSKILVQKYLLNFF